MQLFVAVDVKGQKLNVELALPRVPQSVGEVADEAERMLNAEISARGMGSSHPTPGGGTTPPPAGAIAVEYIVFYEDATKKWKVLEHPAVQLSNYAQIYCVQKGLEHEPIRELPPPTKCKSVLQQTRPVHLPGGGILSGAGAGPGQTPPVPGDRVETVFHQLDSDGGGSIDLRELQSGLAIAGVEFSEDTIAKLFTKTDADDDGEVILDEFRTFAFLFPNTVETLYWRFKHVDENPQSNPVAHELKDARREVKEAQERLKALEQARDDLEKKVKMEKSVARELNPRRRQLETEEQDLMNREVMLQFRRDLVIDAESKFAESAGRFNTAAERQGSPRRARLL